MDQNLCVLCRKQLASVGSGFNILCKECLMEQYNLTCNRIKILACKNLKCEGKMIPDCRFNTILTPRQPSYGITPLGKVIINSLCPYCLIFVGPGTRYFKPHEEKRTHDGRQTPDFFHRTNKYNDLIKREKAVIDKEAPPVQTLWGFSLSKSHF